MTNSMTAFARSEYGAAIWEIRSVNHRYLDLNFRMHDNMRYLETELRNISKSVIHRGKVECTLKINPEEISTTLSINEPLIKELKQTLSQVESITGLTNQGDLLSLIRWPNVLKTTNDNEVLDKEIIAAYQVALDQLINMREREGKELANIISSKVKEVEAAIIEVRHSATDISKKLKAKLDARLKELNVDIEPGRIEQELIIQAQKLDITEELDRLGTQIAEVKRCLNSSEPIGRRLDFLMQEFNREANTLASKSQSSTTTLYAVDLKVLIEQMREQIQNIE